MIKICSPLPFIIPFEHDHSTNVIRVLIYIFISFVHDHSAKIRGHSYSLIYLLINCVNVSYTTFIAVLIYSVHFIHGGTSLIFRALCPWLYEVLAGMKVALKRFSSKYPQHEFKRVTINNWKKKNPKDQESGEGNFINKIGRPNKVNDESMLKIKEIIVGIRLAGDAISLKMVITIGTR